MKFGARILKTGIAIVLALYISELLNLPAPVLSGIAAIFAIQPTIYRSYQTVLEQIQGNIIGALVAVSFVLLFGNDIFIIGLAVMVVITINLKLKMDKTIVLSIVTAIAIMENQEGDFLNFAFIRLSSVLLGIVSSFIVNLVFIPPKYEAKLYTRIHRCNGRHLKMDQNQHKTCYRTHFTEKRHQPTKGRVTRSGTYLFHVQRGTGIFPRRTV